MPPTHAHTRWSSLSSATSLGILNSFIYGEDQACSFRGGRNGINFYDGRFPNTGIKIIGDIFCHDIYTIPFVTLCMFLTKFIQNIGSIKTSIVTKLSGNDFKSPGHSSKYELLLASNGARMISENLGQFHLNSSSSSNNGVIFNR